jgi:two-component system response regulator YesN
LKHPGSRYLAELLLFVPPTGLERSESLSGQVMDSLAQLYAADNIQALLGASAPHSGLDQLNAAYMETVSALDQRPATDTHGCYSFRGTVDTGEQVPGWRKADELLFRLECGAEDAVQQLLGEMFAYFASLPETILASIKYYCYQLANRAKLIVNGYFHQTYEEVSSSALNILNTIFTIEELKAYYAQLFGNITDVLKDKNVYAIDGIVDKIKIYVNRNYQNDLNIDFIASLFYISRPYCSHLFKKATGQNLVDYINSVRIEKAQQLIHNSGKKMYQVAKMVGYDNVKYFFRIFKKVTGQTPEAYKAACSTGG